MENKQAEEPLTLSAGIQASKPSKKLLAVITKWVGIFMEHHHKEISELGMVAYIEGLKDLSVEEVERGCTKALRWVDRMPTVAHIREHARETIDELNERVQAVEMYQKARAWAAKNIDCPMDQREYLPPTLEFSMRACGGFELFTEADKEHWTQKKFVDAYLAVKRDLAEQGITTADRARTHLGLKGAA